MAPRETSRLRTLHDIGQVMTVALDLETLYARIYEQIGRVMDATQFFIALVDPRHTTIQLAYLREDGELLDKIDVPFGNSVTSLVIERGTPLLFNAEEDYDFYAHSNGLPAREMGDLSKESSRSQIFVPLNTDAGTIGALSVQSRRSHAYTQDDVSTLSVIASQAAIAIVNARLFQQSQQSLAQMSALVDVARSMLGSLDLETVLRTILSSIERVVPCSYAAIMLPDWATESLRIVGSVRPRDRTLVAVETNESMRIPFGVGVTGRVFERGETLIVPDVHEFPGHVDSTVDHVDSEIGLPLKRGDNVVGVLNVGKAGKGALPAHELSMLELFASQAAIAIENANLYAAERRRVSQLQTIQHIVQLLTPLHEIPAVASLLSRELAHLIGYHACRVFVLEPGNDLLRPIGVSADEEHAIKVRVGDGITGWIAARGRSVLIRDTLADTRVTHIPGTPHRSESLIGAPLIYEGQVQGVLTLSRLERGQFDEDDLRLLEIVAAQAALAFDRARLYTQMRVDAVSDPLTGLYNRRYLLERFREERSRAQRNQHDLIAMLLDIDAFKRVNDTHGHDAGDIVLQDLASVIRSVMRTEDVVARYGGEEFCILVPEISLQDAEPLATRLCRTIADHVLPPSAGTTHVTVSLGMSLLATSDADAEIFTRADRAMYTVKRMGGNGVCVLADGRFYTPLWEPGVEDRLDAV